MTYINSTITVGGTSQDVYTPDRVLAAWTVRNESTGDLRVTDNGSTPAIAAGILIRAGEAYYEDKPGRGTIKIWGATTGQAFSGRAY